MKEKNLYKEEAGFANKYREAQLEEIRNYIENERGKADIRRAEYFALDFSSPEAYNKSADTLRRDYMRMLGYPLFPAPEVLGTPKARRELVAKDDLGSIYRLNIDAFDGLTVYGLLFVPETEKGEKLPLVIAQHGGGGTPELCSDFFGSVNYNNMVRRVLERRAVVFAPQLMLWNSEQFGPEHNRIKTDAELKQLGSSITALEVFKISRALDYLTTLEQADADRIGMVGLSYGGFYTLYTTAAEKRIKAALSSCFFNDRFKYSWADFTWFGSGGMFLDAEVGSLICPRPLYIEVGSGDELFDAEDAVREFQKVKSAYEKLGAADNVRFNVFEGTHEFDKEDVGIDFLMSHL